MFAYSADVLPIAHRLQQGHRLSKHADETEREAK